MSVVTLGSAPVIFGEVKFPLVGAWTANLTIGGTSAPVAGSPVVLTIGGATFVGSIETSRADGGNRVSCRVIAGAGGLATETPGKGYYSTTRGLVATEILGLGSEALSPLSDASVTGSALEHWQRVAGTVSSALRAVLDGATYRHLPDGSVWVGSDLWLPLELDVKPVSEHPAEKFDRIPLETASIMPGVTYRGNRITSVTYRVDAKKLRADVSYQTNDTLTQLDAAARRATKHTDFHALYVCVVKGHNGDGSVELTPLDSRLGQMSRVPVTIAGVSSIRFLPGTRVLLAHEDGKPNKPRVVQVYQGAVQSVAVTAAESITMTAPLVKAGGDMDLVLYAPFAAAWAALTLAGVPIGLEVPDLIAANTTITKGA